MTGDSSGFAADDWLPVQEELLRGLNHALSNRLASLDAIGMMLDADGTMDEALRQLLISDIARLRVLLGEFRSLPAPGGARREAVRLGDALQLAASLVAHHPDAREATIDAAVIQPGEEPVRLFGPDALRLAVFVLLALARGGSVDAPVRLAIIGGDGSVELRASRAGAAAPVIAVGREHAALQRFAAREGGRLEVAATPEGAELRLRLPGLSRRGPQAA